jgi:glycosyltransferase involved in cell wall biosynthesis
VRGALMGLIPSILKKVFNKELYFYTGCSSLGFLENTIWSENLEYSNKKSLRSLISNNLERFFLLNLIFKEATAIFAENSRMKSILIKLGVDQEKIVILPYYVESYFFKKGKDQFQEYNKEKDTFLIGYTGRFQDYDKLDPVFDALYELKLDGYKFLFNLIGDGPNRKKYEEKVSTLGLDNNVKFLGLKNHFDVASLIQKYHCLILPMVEKLMPSTIPIKMLEAIMMGKIVITNKSGNISSLFLGYQKLIVKKLRSNTLKGLIIEIINNYPHYSILANKIREKQLKNRNPEVFKDIIIKTLKKNQI